MPNGSNLARNFTATQKTFNAVTAIVGGLYLAAYSIIVTIAGTVAAAVLCGWGCGLRIGKMVPADLLLIDAYQRYRRVHYALAPHPQWKRRLADTWRSSAVGHITAAQSTCGSGL
jgi:hypothetical protein